MRGAFNDTFKAFYGPASPYGPPGVQFATDVPCRRVLQTEVFQLDFPGTLSSSWATYDALSLHGPDVSSPETPAVLYDLNTSDQVELASQPGVRYVVYRREEVIPLGRPSYERCLLIPTTSLVVPPFLPPNPPVPPVVPVVLSNAGTSCSTAPAIAVGQVTDSALASAGGGWFQFGPVPLGTVTVSLQQGLALGGVLVWQGVCPSPLSSLGLATLSTPLAFPNLNPALHLWFQGVGGSVGTVFRFTFDVGP